MVQLVSVQKRFCDEIMIREPFASCHFFVLFDCPFIFDPVFPSVIYYVSLEKDG
jgi:hypothetical protein